MKIQIKEPIDKALKTLTKQQHNIISLRYGLEGKEKLTLQEIADDYSLTRERIRQIQNFSLKKLGRNDCVHMLSSIVTHVESMLHKCGGVSDGESLCISCNLTTKVEQNYLRLLLDLSENFSLSPETGHIKSYWYVNDEDKKRTDHILNKLHKKFENISEAVINEEEFKNTFKKSPKNMTARVKKDRRIICTLPSYPRKLSKICSAGGGYTSIPK